MKLIDVFLSRPNWVAKHIDKQFDQFYSLLEKCGFSPRTIGKNVVPLSSPFEDVVNLMNKCQCTIVLGLPQIHVKSGTIKGENVEKRFDLPTEWNQIEAAISIMLKKPTLMMLHNTITARGLFERGAANVFVHKFHTFGPKWILEMEPKLETLREHVAA
ncbi:MAG: hypothetical protein PHP23_12565 [Desulfobacterales bacterium]|nr:hypothetical protein [Desulfobacterales bacterium]MDD4073828.1 hypothetical protein [Desulfobacterales bacterium]MDD4429693.1 hypothetical protein [Paludibacter sp.]